MFLGSTLTGLRGDLIKYYVNGAVLCYYMNMLSSFTHSKPVWIRVEHKRRYFEK